MKITSVEIYKLNVPLKEPFVIAIQTITNANSVLVKINTDEGIYGWGECNPYSSIVNETQDTCYETGAILAKILRGENPLATTNCINLMNQHVVKNRCIKSAFDMALFDIASRAANVPLYQFLGGQNNRKIETDMTVGIGSPEKMAATALGFKNDGFQAIKVKLGTNTKDDVERIRQIRTAIGFDIPLRIDANQGWDEDTALNTLKALEWFEIEHCEQPIHARNITGLARITNLSPIPIMADESVFDAADALILVENHACDFFNIKLAKSGGIREAMKINAIAEAAGIECQIGCFSETRLAMSALMHFALACPNVVHFDMDAPLMLSEDPILRGVKYGAKGTVTIGEDIGIGADVDNDFLKEMTCLIV